MDTPQTQIKIDDQQLKGAYSNAMQVSHTKEEFVLDFMNIMPPQGSVVSRVIVSPGHAKRILSALTENISKYEEVYGTIEESQAPPQINFTIH